MTWGPEANKPTKSWKNVYPFLSCTWREFDPGGEHTKVKCNNIRANVFTFAQM